MFGLSFFELVVIGTVALLLFGPEKLPEIARTLGKVTGELQKHAGQFRKEFYNSVYTPSQELNNLRSELKSSLTTSPILESPKNTTELSEAPSPDLKADQSTKKDSPDE